MIQHVTPPDEPERWLPVPGYEGFYEVSDLGRVRSLPPPAALAHRKRFHVKSGRILKPIHRHYNVVGLYRDGEARQRTIHSLVAEAFIGPRPSGQEVCHGPGGRYDNRLVNLSYGTRAENLADRERDGTLLKGVQVHSARLTDEVVLECRARAVAGETMASLALEFGVSYNAVFCAVRGRTWRHLPTCEDPDIIARGLAIRAASGSPSRAWIYEALRTPCGTGWPTAA